MHLEKQEAEMVALTSCEILDELEKLGITTSSELIQYVIEYATYFAIKDALKEWQSLFTPSENQSFYSIWNKQK